MAVYLDLGDKRVLWELPENQKRFHVEELAGVKEKPVYERIKRAADLVLSLMALPVLSIPMAGIAVAIVLDSPGNPVYAQKRLGRYEEPFTIYKFRTMQIDAEEDGLCWASYDDPRVTRVGQILRKTRLDELPQLFNIIKGEMSIVGPRPERPEFYEVFDTYIDGFRQRMVVMPGLTGLAQVNGGYDLKPEEKIVYDMEYIKNRSVWLDLVCIFKTIRVVITGEVERNHIQTKPKKVRRMKANG